MGTWGGGPQDCISGAGALSLTHTVLLLPLSVSAYNLYHDNYREYHSICIPNMTDMIIYDWMEFEIPINPSSCTIIH